MFVCVRTHTLGCEKMQSIRSLCLESVNLSTGQKMLKLKKTKLSTAWLIIAAQLMKSDMKSCQFHAGLLHYFCRFARFVLFWVFFGSRRSTINCPHLRRST